MGKHSDDEDDSTKGTGSGRGGALGSPAATAEPASPSVDQERNSVVSGGGLVGSEDDEGPSEAADLSPSSQDP